MTQQDQTAFVNFLKPIAELGWQVRAVLSDKQSGLLPAVAEVFPHVPHAFCQMHYLQNVALPLAEADEALKVRVRQEIRESLGEWIRQEQEELPGVLTVTGMLPSQVEEPLPALQSTNVENPTQLRDALVQDLYRRMRYLLTLKARPPFRLAGLEMVARLRELAHCLERLIAHHATPALLTLQHGLQPILHSIQQPTTCSARQLNGYNRLPCCWSPMANHLARASRFAKKCLRFCRRPKSRIPPTPFCIARSKPS